MVVNWYISVDQSADAARPGDDETLLPVASLPLA
jgi:hypothetical protein